MQQRTVDAPMPWVLEETVEVVRLDSHERVQWTDGHMVREFFDMFTSKEACLAGSHELRTQMEVAGITF